MKWKNRKTIESIKQKVCSLKNNKIEKPLSRLIKNKKEEKQIAKIRSESKDIITYFTEIKKDYERML